MIKFIIISRRKPGWSRERFFYEWAFIHVSLMLHTAPSMARFRRYVQHFGNRDIADNYRVLPKPEMDWESYAEHWLEKFEFKHHPDYTEQMQPHSFSDSAMEIFFMEGETVFQRADFHSGGVKLIHRLQKQQGQSKEEFQRYWREEHAPKVVEALKPLGLRKYEIDLPYEFDVESFRESRRGTLFGKAVLAEADGVEELWFDSLEDAVRLGSDPDLGELIGGSLANFVDVKCSYSMFVNERVAFDFVTPEELSPMPAVLDPNSLEARVFKTGRPYHEPRFESE